MVTGTWNATGGGSLGLELYKSKVIRHESDGSMAPKVDSKAFF